MNRRGGCIAIGLGWLAVSVLGCGRTNDAGSTCAGKVTSGPLLALVAASTKDAVREVSDRFTRQSGVEVKISADASSKLAQQIVNAAPADVFLSANEEWADFVKDKGFALEVRPLFGNTLVLVVPAGNPSHVAGPEDLSGAAVQKVAVAGPAVPAGIYARQALRGLKLWDELEKQRKIVSGENVRTTLAYVEQAEVDAGVVYGTDAKITPKVQTVYTFAPSTHDKIVYPLVLLHSGTKNEAARKYFDFLCSDQAAEVFYGYGFVPLPPK